jgi:RNA methyltransferase, TrmH family
MITSKSNQKIKEIRLLKGAKHRERQRAYFIEGIRLVEEALGGNEDIRIVVYSPRLEETVRGGTLLSLARAQKAEAEWIFVSDEVLSSLSDTQSHQGILAVLPKRDHTLREIGRKEGLILCFHNLQDPGNLGAAFRAADAGGGAGIVLSKGSIDPYSPKVIRASMGSFFRVPFFPGPEIGECLDNLRARGFKILAAAPRGQNSFWEVDLTHPAAILFGQEGAGLPAGLLEEADDLLTIPMVPPVESLNVAMAAGLIVYEAFRQRQTLGEEKRGRT